MYPTQLSTHIADKNVHSKMELQLILTATNKIQIAGHCLELAVSYFVPVKCI